MPGQDGTEFVVSSEGIPYASIRATARMLGINQSNLTDWVNGKQGKLRVTNQGDIMKDVIKAEVVTPGGIQGDATLLDSTTIFRLAIAYNPELALAMGAAGAAVYMLKQAGYQVKVVEAVEAPRPYLPPYERNVLVAQSIRTITDTLDDNPRLAQFLIDQTIDECFPLVMIEGEEVEIKGAAEIAEDLGLPVTAKNRSQLGKFMANQGHEILREKRLCNGQMREVNCYRVTPEVEQSVRAFFE
jgi:hypothetical protein